MPAETWYWTGQVGASDDFHNPIGDVFIDGRTAMGPWAIMSPSSWEMYGIGKLGSGCGQMYMKQSDGRWMKVEG